MKGQINEIKEVIDKSTDEGMITFDQSLFELYEKGMISYEDAMRNADSLNNLRLKIKLEGKVAQGKRNLGPPLKKSGFRKAAVRLKKPVTFGSAG